MAYICIKISRYNSKACLSILFCQSPEKPNRLSNQRRRSTLSRQFSPNRREKLGEKARNNDNRLLLLLMTMRIEIGSEFSVTRMISS